MTIGSLQSHTCSVTDLGLQNIIQSLITIRPSRYTRTASYCGLEPGACYSENLIIIKILLDKIKFMQIKQPAIAESSKATTQIDIAITSIQRKTISYFKLRYWYIVPPNGQQQAATSLQYPLINSYSTYQLVLRSCVDYRRFGDYQKSSATGSIPQLTSNRAACTSYSLGSVMSPSQLRCQLLQLHTNIRCTLQILPGSVPDLCPFVSCVCIDCQNLHAIDMHRSQVDFPLKQACPYYTRYRYNILILL